MHSFDVTPRPLMRARLGPLVATVVVASGLVAGVSGAPGATAKNDGGAHGRAPSVSIVGNGYGHGHGLSQWGAQYAVGKGLRHQQILSFYYPGLKRGSLGGSVKVLITADTSSDVMVQDRDGLSAKSLGNNHTYRLNTKAARWWRITPADRGRRSTIGFKANAGWKTLRTVPGQAQFNAGGKPLTLHTAEGNRAYRGLLRSAAPSATSGKRDTVNILSLESYLKGVVPREVPATWHPAAVRAQAVAARTYAAFERREPQARHYQICDTTLCQVYGGFTDEHPASNKAINDTRKQVLLHRGKPAFTQFSASNGGWTSAGPSPYLPERKDPYDKAYRGWTDSVTAKEIQHALTAIGAFGSVKVLARDGHGAFGGRVTQIRITGATTSSVLTGDQFRSYFGLRSTMFDVR